MFCLRSLSPTYIGFGYEREDGGQTVWPENNAGHVAVTLENYSTGVIKKYYPNWKLTVIYAYNWGGGII